MKAGEDAPLRVAARWDQDHSFCRSVASAANRSDPAASLPAALPPPLGPSGVHTGRVGISRRIMGIAACRECPPPGSSRPRRRGNGRLAASVGREFSVSLRDTDRKEKRTLRAGRLPPPKGPLFNVLGCNVRPGSRRLGGPRSLRTNPPGYEAAAAPPPFRPEVKGVHLFWPDPGVPRGSTCRGRIVRRAV